jgi:hypothetical protein
VKRNRQAKSTAMRGYGWQHQLRRLQLAPLVAAGLAICARCARPIEPGTPWDLGHDDYDRTKATRPEHACCNRAAPSETRTSREW